MTHFFQAVKHYRSEGDKPNHSQTQLLRAENKGEEDDAERERNSIQFRRFGNTEHHLSFIRPVNLFVPGGWVCMDQLFRELVATKGKKKKAICGLIDRVLQFSKQSFRVSSQSTALIRFRANRNSSSQV